MPYRPDARQTKHHPSGRRVFPSRPFTVTSSFCSSLHPSGRLSSPSGRPLVFDQASDSFQNYIWEDCCSRPADVDFYPDPFLLKARIEIQIQPSGRLSAWSGGAFNKYGNCVFDFNRPDACLSWSGCAHSKYGNCVLKINRPDDHPPWSRRAEALYGNYLYRTCDRLDDSVSPSGRGSQAGKIFSENLRNSGRTVVRPDGPCPPSGWRLYIL
jgi:hypothetical protein